MASTSQLPNGTQSEDQECILLGFWDPFVIRPAGARWKIVGGCNVAEVPEGQLVDDGDRKEMWSDPCALLHSRVSSTVELELS